jgi:hypothetical protein
MIRKTGRKEGHRALLKIVFVVTVLGQRSVEVVK